VQQLAKAAQALDVERIRPAQPIGRRVDEEVLEGVGHDRDVRDPQPVRLEQGVPHLRKGDRAHLQVAKVARAVGEVGDGQLQHAAAGVERRIGRHRPEDATALLQVAKVEARGDAQAGGRHRPPGVVAGPEVPGPEGHQIAGPAALQDLPGLPEQRGLRRHAVVRHVVGGAGLPLAVPAHPPLHGMAMELHVLPPRPQEADHLRQPLLAEQGRPERLDEEGGRQPGLLERAHHERHPQLLPLVAQAPPRPQLVAASRLHATAAHALLRALHVDRDVNSRLLCGCHARDRRPPLRGKGGPPRGQRALRGALRRTARVSGPLDALRRPTLL
jgi:hypothetical protein